MSAESKKLDQTCPEPFGGEIWGLGFAATHSALLFDSSTYVVGNYSTFNFQFHFHV